MSNPSITTAPTSDPVTISEALAHLRLDESPPDADVVARLITAATQYIEHETGRALMPRTYAMMFPKFPDSAPWDQGAGVYGSNQTRYPVPAAMFRLPHPPLLAVNSITYYDCNEVLNTVDAAKYAATKDEPAKVFTLNSYPWPTGTSFRPDAVTVTYTAGYANAASVPQALKQAILFLIGAWYENRESVVFGVSAAPLPMAVESIIWQYKADFEL